jgi:virginiamycin B lyase
VRRLARTVCVALTVLALPAAAAAQGVVEYPVPEGGGPLFITTGHDGRLWFTLSNIGQIGRMNAAGELQGPVDSQRPVPVDIVAGPEAGMYWTANGSVNLRKPDGAITTRNRGGAYAVGPMADGRVAVTGLFAEASMAVLELLGAPLTFSAVIQVTPSPGGSVRLTDVTTGPDEKLWMTAYEADRIIRVAPSASGGAVDLTENLAPGSRPYRITAGPDGAMWFTEYGANRIGRITTGGVVTEYTLPRPNSGPYDIVAGPDGALWFTEYNPQGNAIGRITTDGQIIEYPVPTANANPWGITVGPDGKIWFTESAQSKVGRVDPSQVSGPGGGGPSNDTTRPAFQGRVTLSRKRFSVGRAATPLTVARPVPSGTQFRFALSEPARVNVKLERRASGRRVRGRCRLGARRGRRCKVWRSAGRSLTRQGLQGPNSIAFSGRLGRKALALGSYRALLSATDASGNRSRTVTLKFAIVRKGR